MAVQYKDYYEVLGVPKDADEKVIKAAYRKLARKYHPDVCADKAEGESRFKEINEAYEVLSDKEKRAKYNQFGSAPSSPGRPVTLTGASIKPDNNRAGTQGTRLKTCRTCSVRERRSRTSSRNCSERGPRRLSRAQPTGVTSSSQ
jgi:curved DNA-binding protein CbpA